MNPPTALGRLLTAAGITLRLDDKGVVRCRPLDAVTPEIRAAVTDTVRADLAAWLRGEVTLCDTCSGRIESAQPAGYGGVWIDGRLFHIATCLPAGWTYDAATGQVAHVEETLFALPAAPNAVAAMAR